MSRPMTYSRTATRLVLTAALALGAATLTACGNDDDGKTASTPGVDSAAGAPLVPRTPSLPAGTRTTTTATTAATTTAATTAATGAPRAAGARPFSAQSPWNTRVDTMSVQSRSSTLIQTATQRLGVREGDSQTDTVQTEQRRINAPLFINTKVWTDPVVDTQDDGVPTKVVCRQINLPPPDNDCGDGWAVSSLDIPADQSPRPQYDGWFTVVDRAKGVAYDLWRARRSADGRSMSYQFMRRWDLGGSGFLAPGVVSARGSGLPLFAGLITPADVRSGVIRHALAIAVPGPAARNYVQPASVTDGNGPFGSLPEGARIRLKPGVSFDRLLSTNPGSATGVPTADGTRSVKRRPFPGNTNRRAARAILTALRDYGAIVVDRAATPTLYAQLNVDWTTPLRRADGALLQADGRHLVGKRERARPGAGTPLLRGSEVQGLLLTDFEVVTLPPLRRDPAAVTSAADAAAAGLNGVRPQPTTTTSDATP